MGLAMEDPLINVHENGPSQTSCARMDLATDMVVLVAFRVH